MNRKLSIHSKNADQSRSSRREDSHKVTYSRSEEERLKRRLEWRRQQELEEEHERRKQKMIMEYELKRQEALRQHARRLLSTHSKSRSRSVESLQRSSPVGQKSHTSVMSEKLDKSSGSVPLFKGPEGTQISVMELRRIKVDIHRDIPATGSTSRLQRDIVNPEDVVLIRRKGEGCKPIFEREELKKGTTKPEEVKEHRTVIAIDEEIPAKTSKSSRRRSVSLSPLRNRDYSPEPSSSRRSRDDDSKLRSHRSDYRSSDRKDRDNSKDKSREYKEKYSGLYKESCASSRAAEKDYTHKRKSSRDRSRSRERDYKKWEIGPRKSSREERSSPDYRGRSRDTRERDWSRLEHSVPTAHYYETVPVPIYYGDFPSRPVMYRPIMPLRGQIPLGRGRPPIMAPVRPFPPRYAPPDVFRLAPPNPRYGPLF